MLASEQMLAIVTLQALLEPGTYSIVVQSDTAEAINFALTVSIEAGGNAFVMGRSRLAKNAMRQ